MIHPETLKLAEQNMFKSRKTLIALRWYSNKHFANIVQYQISLPNKDVTWREILFARSRHNSWALIQFTGCNQAGILQWSWVSIEKRRLIYNHLGERGKRESRVCIEKLKQPLEQSRVESLKSSQNEVEILNIRA